MKVVTVIGARPQFIKAAAVSRAIRKFNETAETPLEEVIVHTGQHFDANMTDVFFEELGLPRPKHHLGISSCGHGEMTGRMLQSVEVLLGKETPDWLLVYGDTNSTLAGALAAAKLHIPVAHVEAGLRSFNKNMPEEINRVLTDHVSFLLFCPTDYAAANLERENIRDGVHQVGDVMYDNCLYYKGRADSIHSLGVWGLEEKNYVLCTLHRQENTDDAERLAAILQALREIAREVPLILPMHPRTQGRLKVLGLTGLVEGIQVIPPVSFLEMTRLEMSARTILTDSGGVQKEAFFFDVPCLTLRDETEWLETVELGANTLCGANTQVILENWERLGAGCRSDAEPYGNGTASEHIVQLLMAHT